MTLTKERAARGAARSAAPTAPDRAVTAGSALFIGNATLLIRFGSLTILTDPNFVGRGAEVALGFGLTAVRTSDPALEADELGQPDVVVVSHDHGDHFDAVAADWLDASVPIVTCPPAASRLEERGFRAVRPLDTWQGTELSRGDTRLQVTALPARHAPGAFAFALPEVMGSMLELWDGGTAGEDRAPDLVTYLSGDTLLDDRLAEIAERFPRIDLAFIHLGGMRVLGMTLTLDAEHGVELLKLLRPEVAIPVHYGDYAMDGSSLAEFAVHVRHAGLSERVRYLRHGESWPLRIRRSNRPAPRHR